MERSTEVSLQLPEEREQKNHLNLSTMMFVCGKIQAPSMGRGYHFLTFKTVCLMLSDATLLIKFWVEVFLTAVYLHNRNPARAVLGKTPFEALTKENKLLVISKSLIVYLCYTHVITDDKENCDAEIRSCIMLGYGTEAKMCWLYDLKEENNFQSRCS